MTFIDLVRRFIPWTREDRGDPEFARFVGELGDSMSWSDLRARCRVAILAEAGNGKSTELQEQARLVEAAGNVSFYITSNYVAGTFVIATIVGAFCCLSTKQFTNCSTFLGSLARDYLVKE
ncbi:hypothetical protein [Cystobacter ferrugineus]|uniref:Uncharacterized protein n=1 Tax=Cystobacter ferrugineus TaxID=83449 RepID=A0A1L9BEP2_9BACT|nr:hypothetical protein [Cystobacter ferrugineus]OJH40737.1 hypothetical protein BON30_07280 [Cystobacter ferrugineus]